MDFSNRMIKRKLSLADPWYQLILRMMKSNISVDFQSKNFLEVGCGRGGFCIRMAEKCKNLVGLDLSASSIRKARNLAKMSGSEQNVDFVIGDAQFLPFRDGSGFITVCSETLEHIPHFAEAFQELVRVTQKSGYLFITVPNYTSTQLLELCLWSLIGEGGRRHGLHIFHYLKVKRLFKRSDLEILDIRGTDFIHIPFLSFKIMDWSKKTSPSESRLLRFMRYVERYDKPMCFFGSNIGILAEVK